MIIKSRYLGNRSRVKNYRKILLIAKYTLLAILLVGLFGILGLVKKVDSPKIAASKPKLVAAISSTNPISDFHLLIPALNISAPVIADVNGKNKTEYFKALEGGVAHYKDTAKPGEGSNIFIFGHSSYYSWAPGDYKDIFKTLEDIKKGDEIDVWWQKKEYKYIVSSTKVVEPTEVSVLKPTSSEQLTLMTCVPPGTAEKRLIVVAKPK